MHDSRKPSAPFASRGVTLNTLKDQLYSLNMRMLLAMQNHDEEMQEEIKTQMSKVQDEINYISIGKGLRR